MAPLPAQRHCRPWLPLPIPQVSNSRNYYTSSERYAGLRRSYRSLACFRVLRAPSRTILEPYSMVQWCALNLFRHVRVVTCERLKRCVLNAMSSDARVPTKLADIPPSRGGVETPETSKYRPSSRCHDQSPSVHLGSDVRWSPYGICHEPC